MYLQGLAKELLDVRGEAFLSGLVAAGHASTPGYTDDAVVAGNTYSYQLRAVNEWGRSDKTAAVLVTP